MTKLLTLTKNDLMNIFREKILVFIFIFMPLGYFLTAKFMLPWLTAEFPVLGEYYVTIYMFVIAQMVTGMGYVSANIILDEKDDNVLDVIKTTPLKPSVFILFRVFFGMTMAFLGLMLMSLFSGLVELSFIEALLVSVSGALTTPLVVLFMAIVARNKVEGLALFKGINLVVILPVGIFFVTSAFKYLLAIIPTFWTFMVLDRALADDMSMWLYMGASIIVHVLGIYVLLLVFRRKVF